MMAKGDVHTPDPAADERWRLARREDLAHSMGVVLSVPIHGQDLNGIWRSGLRSTQGWADERMTAQFQSEMDELFSSMAESLIQNRVLSRSDVESFRSHPYEVGPAAQGWPLLFFDFVNNARPILEDGATLFAWGYFIKDLLIRIHEWGTSKEREASQAPTSESSPYSHGQGTIPQVSFTRAAITSLCYVDLVDYYSVGDSVMIETFPRSQFSYMSQDHPGGGESYVLRAIDHDRTFIYHVLGGGKSVSIT